MPASTERAPILRWEKGQAADIAIAASAAGHLNPSVPIACAASSMTEWMCWRDAMQISPRSNHRPFTLLQTHGHDRYRSLRVHEAPRALDIDCGLQSCRPMIAVAGTTVAARGMAVHPQRAMAACRVTICDGSMPRDMQRIMEPARNQHRFHRGCGAGDRTEDSNGRRAGSYGDVGCRSFFPTRIWARFGEPACAGE